MICTTSYMDNTPARKHTFQPQSLVIDVFTKYYILRTYLFRMDAKQGLLDWLTLYIPDPQVLEATFQAHFTNIPCHASWRLDKIWDKLYYIPKYKRSIIPWTSYLEIFHQHKLLFLLIWVKFTCILCPLFPMKISMSPILYMEIDLCNPSKRIRRHYFY